MTKFRRTTAIALAAALAVTSFGLAPAQAAPAAKQAQAQPAEAATTIDLSARKRHHRYRSSRGGQRAALAMFGMMMGTIATLAARDRYRDRYGYYGHRYYGHRHYYGGPRYYRYPRYRY